MDYKLRPWKPSNKEALVKYANNAKIAKYMTDRFPHPYTSKAGENFISITTASENVDRFKVIEIDGELAGGIGIHPKEDVFRKNAEIAFWLAEPFWNLGITTKVVFEMTEYGFKTFDITRIFASVFGTNTASARVLEKAGYSLESIIPKSIIKNGELEDWMVYGINKH